jgi:sugar transferase (PEP-CTERM/EpsH1 system associated)
VPYPLEKGDKLRAYYQIRELAKYHDLFLCALSDQPIHPQAEQKLLPFVKELRVFRFGKMAVAARLAANFFSRRPFQVAYFYSKKIQKQINQYIEKTQPDFIYCQLIRTAEYLKDQAIDKTIDYQDVFSKGLDRRLQFAPWYMKIILKSEFSRVKNYEREVYDVFDNKTIISYPDRDLIPHPERDKIHVIPNGVDTDFFHPVEAVKDHDVIFSGNMGYPPNINGAEYLVHEIMPLVWAEKPDAKVIIAGANPSTKVRALASNKVLVTGWVDDIRLWYARAKVFVAPMQIGTGLQNKVLEAMAMKLPVVTSPLANQALWAKPGIELLIGNNPSHYAQQILSLLNDSNFSNKLSSNGLKFIIEQFQWSIICQRLEKIITTPGASGN